MSARLLTALITISEACGACNWADGQESAIERCNLTTRTNPRYQAYARILLLPLLLTCNAHLSCEITIYTALPPFGLGARRPRAGNNPNAPATDRRFIRVNLNHGIFANIPHYLNFFALTYKKHIPCINSTPMQSWQPF